MGSSEAGAMLSPRVVRKLRDDGFSYVLHFAHPEARAQYPEGLDVQFDADTDVTDAELHVAQHVLSMARRQDLYPHLTDADIKAFIKAPPYEAQQQAALAAFRNRRVITAQEQPAQASTSSSAAAVVASPTNGNGMPTACSGTGHVIAALKQAATSTSTSIAQAAVGPADVSVSAVNNATAAPAAAAGLSPPRPIPIATQAPMSAAGGASSSATAVVATGAGASLPSAAQVTSYKGNRESSGSGGSSVSLPVAAHYQPPQQQQTGARLRDQQLQQLSYIERPTPSPSSGQLLPQLQVVGRATPAQLIAGHSALAGRLSAHKAQQLQTSTPASYSSGTTYVPQKIVAGSTLLSAAAAARGSMVPGLQAAVNRPKPAATARSSSNAVAASAAAVAAPSVPQGAGPLLASGQRQQISQYQQTPQPPQQQSSIALAAQRMPPVERFAWYALGARAFCADHIFNKLERSNPELASVIQQLAGLVRVTSGLHDGGAEIAPLQQVYGWLSRTESVIRQWIRQGIAEVSSQTRLAQDNIQHLSDAYETVSAYVRSALVTSIGGSGASASAGASDCSSGAGGGSSVHQAGAAQFAANPPVLPSPSSAVAPSPSVSAASSSFAALQQFANKHNAAPSSSSPVEIAEIGVAVAAAASAASDTEAVVSAPLATAVGTTVSPEALEPSIAPRAMDTAVTPALIAAAARADFDSVSVIPSSMPSAAVAGVKRGRGRPPKVQVKSTEERTGEGHDSDGSSRTPGKGAGSKRGRGGKGRGSERMSSVGRDAAAAAAVDTAIAGASVDTGVVGFIFQEGADIGTSPVRGGVGVSSPPPPQYDRDDSRPSTATSYASAPTIEAGDAVSQPLTELSFDQLPPLSPSVSPMTALANAAASLTGSNDQSVCFSSNCEPISVGSNQPIVSLDQPHPQEPRTVAKSARTITVPAAISVSHAMVYDADVDADDDQDDMREETKGTAMGDPEEHTGTDSAAAGDGEDKQPSAGLGSSDAGPARKRYRLVRGYGLLASPSPLNAKAPTTASSAPGFQAVTSPLLLSPTIASQPLASLLASSPKLTSAQLQQVAAQGIIIPLRCVSWVSKRSSGRFQHTYTGYHKETTCAVCGTDRDCEDITPCSYCPRVVHRKCLGLQPLPIPVTMGPSGASSVESSSNSTSNGLITSDTITSSSIEGSASAVSGNSSTSGNGTALSETGCGSGNTNGISTGEADTPRDRTDTTRDSSIDVDSSTYPAIESGSSIAASELDAAVTNVTDGVSGIISSGVDSSHIAAAAPAGDNSDSEQDRSLPQLYQEDAYCCPRCAQVYLYEEKLPFPPRVDAASEAKALSDDRLKRLLCTGGSNMGGPGASRARKSGKKRPMIDYVYVEAVKGRWTAKIVTGDFAVIVDCGAGAEGHSRAVLEVDGYFVRRYGGATLVGCADGAGPPLLQSDPPDQAIEWYRQYVADWAASGSPYAYSRLVGMEDSSAPSPTPISSGAAGMSDRRASPNTGVRPPAAINPSTVAAVPPAITGSKDVVVRAAATANSNTSAVTDTRAPTANTCAAATAPSPSPPPALRHSFNPFVEDITDDEGEEEDNEDGDDSDDDGDENMSTVAVVFTTTEGDVDRDR